MPPFFPSEGGQVMPAHTPNESYQCPECQQWHRTLDNLTMHRKWSHPEYIERELERALIRRAANAKTGNPLAIRALEATQNALRTIRSKK